MIAGGLAADPTVAQAVWWPTERGCGAAGSAPHWQGGGQGFESPQLHHPAILVPHRSRGARTLGQKRCRGSVVDGELKARAHYVAAEPRGELLRLVSQSGACPAGKLSRRQDDDRAVGLLAHLPTIRPFHQAVGRPLPALS